MSVEGGITERDDSRSASFPISSFSSIFFLFISVSFFFIFLTVRSSPAPLFFILRFQQNSQEKREKKPFFRIKRAEAELCVREKPCGRIRFVALSCVFLSLSRLLALFFSFDFVHETSRLPLRLKSLTPSRQSLSVCVRASVVRAVCLRSYVSCESTVHQFITNGNSKLCVSKVSLFRFSRL